MQLLYRYHSYIPSSLKFLLLQLYIILLLTTLYQTDICTTININAIRTIVFIGLIFAAADIPYLVITYYSRSGGIIGMGNTFIANNTDAYIIIIVYLIIGYPEVCHISIKSYCFTLDPGYCCKLHIRQ